MLGSLIPGRFIGKDIMAVYLGADTLKIAHATRVVPGRVKIANLVSRDIRGLSDEAIAGLVEACVGEMEVRNPMVINVIPPNLSITRNMEVPSLDEDEVRDIVNLQASRHTPYAREDIVVDYIDMGVYKGAYTRVLVVVVSHDNVRRQLDMLESVGLSADKVLFGAEVIGRIFSRIAQSGPPGSPSGIIHVDETSTDFLITTNDKPIFIRNIPIGAGHLADDQEGYLARFTEEIRESLHVYQSEEIEKNPDSFMFAGAVEGMKDLKPVLDDALKIPAEMITYSRHLSLSEQAEETVLADRRISFLSIIASLHVHQETEVDLVPEEVKSRMQFEEKTKHVIKTGILAVIILFLVTAILSNKIVSKELYLDRLTSEYQADIDKAKKLEKDDARVGRVMRFLSERHYALDVLKELYRLVPDAVKLTEIRFDTEAPKGRAQFFVKGTARSLRALRPLTENMEKSEFFEKVERPRAPSTKEGVDFEIRCNLKKRSGTE